MRISTAPFATLLLFLGLLICGQGCGLATDALISTIIDEITKDDPSLLPSAGRSLVEIDLSTGDRTVLSSDVVGSGAPFVDPRVAALDESRGEALFWDEGRAAIVRVDLSDGDRLVLANGTTGAGPDLTSVRAMLVDAAGDRLLLADVTAIGAAILSVDLATGDRTLISDAVTGSGPALDTPTCIALHSAGNRVLVGDGATNAVVSVNLGNGNRATLSGASNGAGPLFQSLDGLTMESTQGPLLVLDAQSETIYDIDIANGNRGLISTGVLGQGPPIEKGADLAYNAAASRVLVVQRYPVDEMLLDINPDTGDRSVLSGQDWGSGRMAYFPLTVLVESGGARAIVLNRLTP